MNNIKAWIRQWKDYLKNAFQPHTSKVTDTSSEREMCENMLHNLQPFLGNPYNPRKANEIIVQSNKRDLIQLIHQLKEINKVLQSGQPLQANHCEGVLDDISLDELFITSNKRYVDSEQIITCLLYTSPSPRDRTRSRMPSST